MCVCVFVIERSQQSGCRERDHLEKQNTSYTDPNEQRGNSTMSLFVLLSGAYSKTSRAEPRATCITTIHHDIRLEKHKTPYKIAIY